MHIQKHCRKYKRDKRGKDGDKNEENGTTTIVFEMMLPLFVMMILLIFHVRIPFGLQIQQLLTMLCPDVIFTHPTLLEILFKLGWEIKGWLMLWVLETFG